MDPTPARLSTLLGVGGSLLFHASVVTWLAFAPAPTPTVAARPAGDDHGFDLALFPPTTPAPTPTPPEPAPSAAERAVPPEEAKPPADPPAPPPEAVKPPPPPPPQPEVDLDKLKLGIDKSPAPPETKTFLGTDKPTENLAPTSEVEQPALTPDPGKLGTSGLDKTPTNEAPSPTPPAPAAPSAETRPVPSPEAALPTPSPANPGPSGEVPSAEATANEASPTTDANAGPATPPMTEGPPVPPVPGPTETSGLPPTPSAPAGATKDGDGRPITDAMLEDLFGQMPILLPGRGFLYIAPPPPSLPRTAPPAAQPQGGGSPASAPQAPAPSGAPGAEKARAGDKSVKESSAFTIKKTLEYKPGNPLAAEGIEVTTVDPDVSMLSLMTGSIRNPVILLHFGPDGKVKSAEFKDGLSSGRKDWDDPIMHAMHRWTLGGKKFKELMADSATQEVVMSVRLLLR